MIYMLPPLPYASDALEPLMSKETIDYHYGKHLQTYIDNLNNLIPDTPYENMQLDEIVMTSSGPVYNNAAQINGIQIVFQNPFFRILLFQSDCQILFLNFSAQAIRKGIFTHPVRENIIF